MIFSPSNGGLIPLRSVQRGADDQLIDRLERWFLYADYLKVTLATLLAIGLPTLTVVAAIRLFT